MKAEKPGIKATDAMQQKHDYTTLWHLTEEQLIEKRKTIRKELSESEKQQLIPFPIDRYNNLDFPEYYKLNPSDRNKAQSYLLVSGNIQHLLAFRNSLQSDESHRLVDQQHKQDIKAQADKLERRKKGPCIIS